MSDYEKAKQLGLTNLNRWEQGIEHHPMSQRVVYFLAEHDFNDYGDYFRFKIGGDGDNGETLMYELDAFFEMQDAEKPDTSIFDEMINDWKSGKPVTKLCYGLTDEHMKVLASLFEK